MLKIINMRYTSFLIVFLLTVLIYSCQFSSKPDICDVEQIDDSEIASGGDWKPLFDGISTNGWRGFKQSEVGEGWKVMDSCLVGLGMGGDLGGDIITLDQYEDFELYLEWAISPEGNSGILFHVLEGDYPAVYVTGPEYQIIDDVGYPDELEEWQKTGANYAMHYSSKKELKPVGQFNSSKIIVKNGKVEHWLNGQKIIGYSLWSTCWKRKVEKGKWKDFPGYGLARKGHIALQDHGSVVKFRNIKIRDLTDLGKSVFNGKNLDGWKPYGTEKWYVDKGELVCESGPDEQYGYLATDKNYKDFILRLQFKQEADGNSGVFFRSSLDGTKISGWQVEVAPKGKDTGGIYESYGRGWLWQIPAEKENILKPGEWNDLVIKVQEDRVMTWLNNEMMTDLTDKKIFDGDGVVALQIHDGGGIKVRWRNIFIKEL